MSRRPAKVTQTEIARALRAAAALDGVYQVEIAPDGTIRIAPVLVRAFCTEIFCRLTLALCRRVSTMAPIIATNSTTPASAAADAVRVTYEKEKPNVDTDLKADDEPDVVRRDVCY